MIYKKDPRISILWAALLGLDLFILELGARICPTVRGCQLLQDSSYASMFFGIRTALVGITGYSLILAALGARGQLGIILGAFLGTFGIGVSLFLSYSSVVVFNTTCQWCLGSAAAMATIFILSWWRALKFSE